jgi:phosphoribosylformylglycinamidine synthase subunit PurS
VHWSAEVHVRLRAGIADPEGLTIAGGLRALGFETVHEVRHGKLLQVDFDAPDPGSAREAVASMCRRLLANPVMEVATWELRAIDEPGEELRLA